MTNSKINWDSFSFMTFVENHLKNSFIIGNENDIVIVKVTTFKDMHNISKCVTRTPWAIAHYEHFWDNYVTMEKNHQYVCFNFNKKINERDSMYGFTVGKVKGHYVLKFWYDGFNSNVSSSNYKHRHIIPNILNKEIENILSYSNN